MAKLQSLVLLIHSMTMPEKKAFRIKTSRYKTKPAYVILCDIIENQQEKPDIDVQFAFFNQRPKASFDTSVKYLYELLLESMLELRKKQDSYYFLFNKILKARILYEKSLFDQCFDLLLLD